MTERQRLPNRRPNRSFGFRWQNMPFIGTAGYFPDGRLAEVFISNGQIDSTADGIARDSAVTCSIALQYGAPLDVLRGALLRDGQGEPASPLGVALDQIATMTINKGDRS